MRIACSAVKVARYRTARVRASAARDQRALLSAMVTARGKDACVVTSSQWEAASRQRHWPKTAHSVAIECLWCRRLQGTRRVGSLRTGFPVIRVIPGRLRGGFGHVLPLLRLSVPFVAGAVIDLRLGIHPDLAGAAAGCGDHVGWLLRLRLRSSRGRRSGGLGRCRGGGRRRGR